MKKFLTLVALLAFVALAFLFAPLACLGVGAPMAAARITAIFNASVAIPAALLAALVLQHGALEAAVVFALMVMLAVTTYWVVRLDDSRQPLLE